MVWRAARSLTVPVGPIPGDPPGVVTFATPAVEGGRIRDDERNLRHLPSRRSDAKFLTRPGHSDVAALIKEVSSYLQKQPAEPSPTTSRERWSPSPVRVLLPYSGSEEADRSLEATVHFVQLMAAEVRVVHVREYDICRGSRFFVDSHEDVVRLTLNAVYRLRRRGVAATGIIRSAPRGAVPDAILQEASDSRASLIVLGAYRRRRLVDLVFPTVLRRVLGKAACPVLVVRTDPPVSVRPPRSAAPYSKREKRAA